MQIHEPPHFEHDHFQGAGGSTNVATKPPAVAFSRRQQTTHGMIGHVLVATRLDPRDRDAVMFALNLAAGHRARVTLLHVAEPAESRSAHWLDGIDRLHHALSNQRCAELSVVDNVRANLTSYLHREIPADLWDSLDIEVECRIGNVATEIANFANSQNVDLVVLCNRPSAWRLSFFRSLSQEIVEQCSKPVVFAQRNQQRNHQQPN